jgi:hypothetical protein
MVVSDLVCVECPRGDRPVFIPVPGAGKTPRKPRPPEPAIAYRAHKQRLVKVSTVQGDYYSYAGLWP